MPYDQPQDMPADMDELDFMIAKAYTQGVDTGKRQGRTDAVEAFKKFFLRTFYASKGRRRRADQNDPKTAAINDIWAKFNEKLEDGTLWQ
jgi:hypothetical protein